MPCELPDIRLGDGKPRHMVRKHHHLEQLSCSHCRLFRLQFRCDLTIPAGVTGSSYSFTSAALWDFLNADTDGHVTFMLTRTTNPTSGFNLAFASSEYATTGFRPALSYAVVPEPRKSILLMAAGFGLLLRRRR